MTATKRATSAPSVRREWERKLRTYEQPQKGPAPMTPATARDDFDQWFDDLLTLCEDDARATLTRLRLPADRMSLHDILSGTAPWPRRTTAYERRQARDAWHVLAHIQQVRSYISPGNEHATLAAHAALQVGLFASGRAIDARLAKSPRQKGGRATGRTTAAGARKTAKTIDRFSREWRTSEDLREEYPSEAVYVQQRTQLSRTTIWRRLRKSRFSS